MSVSARLEEVRQRVASAAARSGRSMDEIEVVAVGKGHSVAILREAFEAGQSVFGENRAQELRHKVGGLPGSVIWHFVGPLQTNKVRIVRPRVSLLQSFDRDRLVRPWLKGQDEPPPVLLQVNIGQESQKHGVPPALVAETFDRWEQGGVRLHGIMAIPPLGNDPEDARPYFIRMRRIRDELSERSGRDLTLSMGMTDDFEVAIEEGSTMVRVGRAIFGRRPTVE
ncbi:MAG: YggS family pyridoxal phosphate-dependent enzyme [bacterium]|nr:YggS family pyridoxal phosphate-dependent enzyme [bacterium]MDE0290495.1 YggS family pyridoxal phosphate-dependent enzyme [bacterium]MDE0439517.1 YggS family pyridoxal phosphate-dependent enzyme [bacterium]